MKHDHFVVQRPAMPARQLFLLFHGVGDTAEAMGKIGHAFAPQFPDALIVSIGGATQSASGTGREWFSVAGVTEENRPARIEAVMPTFIEIVRYWQQDSGVPKTATALIGFSQGAIMALESIKAHPGLAARVISFSGRYAELPQKASASTTIHLIHGDNDRVIHATHSVDAAEKLLTLGGDVTLDLIDDLAHTVDDRSMKAALDHLRYTVPKHYFDEALGGGAPKDDDVIELL